MQNILITGGLGFIGSHLVKKLFCNDYHIVIVDYAAPPYRRHVLEIFGQQRLPIYRYDIINREAISDIIRREGIDTCIHLAAKIGVRDSVPNAEMMDVNVRGTCSILESCSMNGVKNFIFASSAAVYGEPTKLPTPEDHPLNPISVYGASKVAGEALVSAYRNSKRINNIVTLRFFNVFGEFQNPLYAGIITQFAERLSKNQPPVIYGDGNQTRDFISVQDIVDAIVAVLKVSEGPWPDVLNVGTGGSISINDLARAMIKQYGVNDLEPIYHKAAKGDVTNSCADTVKIRRTLKSVASPDSLENIKRMLLQKPLLINQ